MWPPVLLVLFHIKCDLLFLSAGCFEVNSVRSILKPRSIGVSSPDLNFIYICLHNHTSKLWLQTKAVLANAQTKTLLTAVCWEHVFTLWLYRSLLVCIFDSSCKHPLQNNRASCFLASPPHFIINGFLKHSIRLFSSPLSHAALTSCSRRRERERFFCAATLWAIPSQAWLAWRHGCLPHSLLNGSRLHYQSRCLATLQQTRRPLFLHI